jgi:hypothetical protein
MGWSASDTHQFPVARLMGFAYGSAHAFPIFRHSGMRLLAQARNPLLPVVVMDSGLALRAPRNDGELFS